MPHTRLILLLTLCFLAFTALAQPGPLLVIEHDWRILIGDDSYGILQTSLRGDPNHWTGVYCGRHLFTVKMRIGDLLALVLLPVGVVGAVLWSSRSRKNHAENWKREGEAKARGES